MKSSKRIILGLVASFLFAVGFARAADRVDLLVQGASAAADSQSMASAAICAIPCRD